MRHTKASLSWVSSSGENASGWEGRSLVVLIPLSSVFQCELLFQLSFQYKVIQTSLKTTLWKLWNLEHFIALSLILRNAESFENSICNPF